MKNIRKSIKYQTLGFETIFVFERSGWGSQGLCLHVLVQGLPLLEACKVTAVGASSGSRWVSGLIQCGSFCTSTLLYNYFHIDPFLCLEETQSRSPKTLELVVFQFNMSEKHPKSLAKIISYQVSIQICRLKRVHESQISSQPFAA